MLLLAAPRLSLSSADDDVFYDDPEDEMPGKGDDAVVNLKAEMFSGEDTFLFPRPIAARRPLVLCTVDRLGVHCVRGRWDPAVAWDWHTQS